MSIPDSKTEVTATEKEVLTTGQVNAHFRQLQNELRSIREKLTELEIEQNEHNLVIAAIEKLEPSRKCWRLIGGVLVERNVGEVLPAVTKNRDGIAEISRQLNEQMKKKESELNNFVALYKSQVQSEKEEEERDRDENRSAKTSTGVLV
eukprot:TRINITY_DN2326_c0_g1_i1.p1 TRINITY_DN2326_c0_g1~~TRINITY_DN2326_c0_g1_i1.p1  ORF type:complete len:149 (-),score=47.03 TRINITY_DN2326_c0_g1_i1:12-458(-)